MLTKNVSYAEKPDKIIVNRIGQGYTARVDLPTNIKKHTDEEGNETYTADVYSLEAGYTAGLKERIEANYDAWMDVAKEIPAPQPTLQDVIDGVNALAEIVLGGE